MSSTMGPWSAVALALDEPGAGGLGSRLSKYLHPLAGRPLAWHALWPLGSLAPPPSAAVLLAGAGTEVGDESFADLPVPVRVVEAPADGGLAAARPHLPPEGDVLVLDAAASVSAVSLQRLVEGETGTLLVDPRERPLAAWVSGDGLDRVLEGGGLRAFAAPVDATRRIVDPDAFVVESRAELARAVARVRDRLVAALMEGGATFLLPETVLVDVDVRVGRDAVIYPNVVLEGETTIGDETVVGPGCRIVDSWIGSGVELKGFNYVSHTSLRNRAILEPHVRRGFD
jgi:bifunctional N-acetylglucosamine-1-phosphate-uridyltransferase/glucosamine-1-phosphate-acetyltransferase GlmU-like protein